MLAILASIFGIFGSIFGIFVWKNLGLAIFEIFNLPRSNPCVSDVQALRLERCVHPEIISIPQKMQMHFPASKTQLTICTSCFKSSKSFLSLSVFRLKYDGGFFGGGFPPVKG